MATVGELFDLSGRVALLTGTSRGLGLQIASALGEYGAALALVARGEEELERSVEALQSLGVNAAGFPSDLGDPASPAMLVERVMRHFGRIDVLVNSAGATWGAPAEHYPIAGWDKVMAVGVKGLFLLIQATANAAFFPQQGGSVINVAPIEGLLGHHSRRLGTIAYNTAKGAVINLTRALAAEWGPRNIRVNSLAPGLFLSKMTATTLAEHERELIEGTPLGRLGGDVDLKGPALLLASAAVAHITGQVIVVDGGASVI